MRITFIIHKKLDKAKECIWLADIFQKRVLIPRFYDILIFIDLWFSFSKLSDSISIICKFMELYLMGNSI